MQQDSLTVSAKATSTASASSVRWSGIALFVALACAISWATWLGLGALGVPVPIRAPLGMFGPAIAATLVRGPLRHEGFADAGLRLVGRDRPGGGWMYLAAYLVIPLLIAAGIGLSLLIGYQHWTDPVATLQQALAAQLAAAHQPLPLGDSLHQIALVGLLSQLGLAVTLGIPINMIFTFGEEFGWRGYLLPRLAPLGGGWAALLTGIIWGLWHAPFIITTSYNFLGHPWLGALAMVLLTTALSFVYAWLRFRSGSVWPSTLAHAAANAQAGIALLVLAPPADSLLRPPYGLIEVAVIAAFALVLLFTGRLNPRTAPSTVNTERGAPDRPENGVEHVPGPF
ncbi:MAG TPA: CPBP family intramembrane glutamic endopeptidase [Ktedonobacterales bacterium]|nr:CPBP family intramembrane glutamic endopeptidase [Ktedonobacterales bacterium]